MPGQKVKRDYHADPFKNPYLTCFNYNDQDLPREEITIAAFDPGYVNTGFRLEKRTLGPDGGIKVNTIIQRLIVSDIKKDSKHFFVRMRDEIKSMKRELQSCDYILVESQMHNNPQATRMCQHIISSILMILDDQVSGEDRKHTLVMEVEPTIKSRSFSGSKGVRGKELKKWAVDKALNILEARGDTEGIELVKASKKKDDQCDVILYCDSWARFLKCEQFCPEEGDIEEEPPKKTKKKKEKQKKSKKEKIIIIPED